MPRTRDSPQYLPVPPSVDDELQSSEQLSAVLNNPPTFSRSVLWLCIACTVVNILITVLNAWQRTTVYAPFDSKDIYTLRRPSQYIGFDSITRPSPPVQRNFTNFPFAVAQIDVQEPLKVFEIDTKRFMSLSGTVYPDDKKVVVTDKISTILQFRAIDYGMEICELHIDLPPSSVLAGQVEAISVYRLESSSPLDLGSLSYKTSPRRIGCLGDIYATADKETHWHRKMTCTLEAVLTLELACPQDIPVGKRCNLEWLQSKEATPGEYRRSSMLLVANFVLKVSTLYNVVLFD
ncbi:hypothetical protein C0995_009678 [Termitomyces sp. Mi166|nr:hypothetical protein C0995_009678 [Termitomyces sp. Mi166\